MWGSHIRYFPPYRSQLVYLRDCRGNGLHEEFIYFNNMHAGLYNSLSSLREITFSAILSRIGLCFYSEGVWLLWSPENGKVFLIGTNVLMVALAIGCGIGIHRRRKLGKASGWGIIGVLAAIPFGMSTVMLISNLFHWMILYLYNLAIPSPVQAGERPRHWEGRTMSLSCRRKRTNGERHSGNQNFVVHPGAINYWTLPGICGMLFGENIIA